MDVTEETTCFGAKQVEKYRHSFIALAVLFCYGVLILNPCILNCYTITNNLD